MVVEGDRFVGFLATGAIAPWRADAYEQITVVVSAAAAATGRLVTGGFTTFHEGVIDPWFLPTFMAAAGVATSCSCPPSTPACTACGAGPAMGSEMTGRHDTHTPSSATR